MSESQKSFVVVRSTCPPFKEFRNLIKARIFMVDYEFIKNALELNQSVDCNSYIQESPGTAGLRVSSTCH